MLQQPAIILADELTGNLDSQNAVMEGVKQYYEQLRKENETALNHMLVVDAVVCNVD